MLCRALLVAVVVALATPAFAGSLPQVDGKDPDGTEVSLPTDLRGDVTLLVLGFERKQDTTLEGWRAAARELRGEHPGLEYLVMPVLPSGLFLLGRAIRSGLRDQHPSAEERRRTVLLFTDTDDLREALGVGTGTAVRAVLVDRSGAVLWWASGEADKPGLKAAVDAAR